MNPRDFTMEAMQAEIDALKRKVEELEYKVAELNGAELAPILGMMPGVFRLAHLLARRAPMVASHEALLHACSPNPLIVECGRKLVGYRVHQARGMLSKKGIKIHNVFGRGYRMDAADAERFMSLVRQKNTMEKAA